LPRHICTGHQSPISGKPNLLYGVFPLSKKPSISCLVSLPSLV
jgi:hypothetical protein